jgi:hypothetical protein
MSLVVRALVIVGLWTLTACDTPADEARESFSRSLSCPLDAVSLRIRTDLDTYSISYNGNTPTPSKEVAADPQRLAVWQADQQKSKDFWASQGPVLYELKGCGHETLYICETSTSRGNSSKGNTGWGCGDELYPPDASVWDPAASANFRPVPPPLAPPPLKQLTMATLASAPLTASRTLGPLPLVDAPPLQGAAAKFDPVANLSWASSIATAWSSDAKLWRLHWIPNEEEGTMDGTANLSTPADSVSFEYTSASRGTVDLEIALRASQVYLAMRPHPGATPANPLPVPTCPIARVFSKIGAVKASTDSNFTVSLEVAGNAAYWHVAHYRVAQGRFVKTIDDDFDATTCAVLHPTK